MEKLVSVDEMRAIEQEADAVGLHYSQMMEHAGLGLAEQIEGAYASQGDRVALALVGNGNNGGDALVALANLAGRGWTVRAYLVRSRSEADPLVRRLRQAGGQVFAGENDQDHAHLNEWLATSRVLVDGVFGTGFRLPMPADIQGTLAFARDFVARNNNKIHVVAVDCPSGVDCDRGTAAAEVIPAEITVVMGAVKVGLLNYPAASLTGALRSVSIGSLDDLEAWKAVSRLLVSEEAVRAWLPARPLDAHKGSFGTAVIVAGCKNYTGAALLAGESAYRVGAGLVSLAIPGSLHAALAGHLPEATWIILPEDSGMIAPGAAEVLGAHLQRATALLVGPGLGAGVAPGEFLGTLLHSRVCGLLPCVFDADGLRHLAAVPSWHALLPAGTILTPHLGEMAVLTGLSLENIRANRLKMAEQYAQAWGHVVVLKGAYTVIAEPNGSSAVIPVATPALARAGTGDVLAGIIVGLRAQGVGAFHAAVLGAWLHAQAGICAAQRLGSTASVLAGDVLRSVPLVMAQLYDHH